MSRTSLQLAFVSALLLVVPMSAHTGCTEEPVMGTEVLSLELCPIIDGKDKCARVANSAGHIYVRVCLPEQIKTQKTDVSVNLKISSGSWDNPPLGGPSTGTTQIDVRLENDRCTLQSFRTDGNPGDVRIDAALLGYSAFKFVTLDAAGIQTVEASAVASPVFMGQTPVDVQAKVDGEGGLPSRGTTVNFSIVEPAGLAYVSPTLVVVDDKGVARATVSPGGATVVKVKMDATPPSVPSLPEKPSKSATLVLKQSGGDAGVEADIGTTD